MSARILFVDDELRVLEGIENLLFDGPADWRASFVTSGRAALDALDHEPFDVLVTDMRMPEMSGAELLERASARHPDVVRVILSGHTERETAERAVLLAHEFLSKPCDSEALLKTLHRALSLSTTFVDETLRRVLCGTRALPARPEMHVRLTDAIEAGASLDEIARIAERDIGVSSKLLHVANIAFYARGRSIATVRDAVQRLGTASTAAIALSVGTFRDVFAPKWLDVDAMHEHGVAIGTLATTLVPRSMAGEAFLAGLLHDIGELVLAAHFEEHARRASELAPARNGRWRFEAELLGFDHADVGAHLLDLWQLPPSLTTTVRRHHRSGLASRGEVELAVFAAERALTADPFEVTTAPLDAAEVNAVTRALSAVKERSP